MLWFIKIPFELKWCLKFLELCHFSLKIGNFAIFGAARTAMCPTLYRLHVQWELPMHFEEKLGDEVEYLGKAKLIASGRKPEIPLQIGTMF